MEESSDAPKATRKGVACMYLSSSMAAVVIPILISIFATSPSHALKFSPVVGCPWGPPPCCAVS